MATLTVGSGKEFSSIEAAVAASHNGDTIQVQAGTYTNNFTTISHNLTLEAVGGMVNMVETTSPPNGKGMILVGTTGDAPNVTIDGFEIQGVSVSSGNGAGIRYQSGNLNLVGDWFQHNQDGLLATPFVSNTGSLTINDTEFGYNGTGDGQTHNLYVCQVASLTVENSYLHDANVGMEIQSRAAHNTIEDNRIFDNNGTASYSVSLPNGGDDLVSGNVIEKGLYSQNPSTISFAQAGTSNGGQWAGSRLSVSNDTFVNDLTAHANTAVWNDGGPAATLSGNAFYHVTYELVGAGSISGSTVLGSRPTLNTSHPWIGHT